MVVNDGVRLGGRVVEALYKKSVLLVLAISLLMKDFLVRLLVPALKWLQEPRRRGVPPPGHQDGPPKVDCQMLYDLH